MTVDEVKNLLKIYYDIPQMIAEEWATIRHCEAEKSEITLPSVNLTGMPGGKGMTVSDCPICKRAIAIFDGRKN